MYKQIGTISGTFFLLDDKVELFCVTFDMSGTTLSINTHSGPAQWTPAYREFDAAEVFLVELGMVSFILWVGSRIDCPAGLASDRSKSLLAQVLRTKTSDQLLQK